MIQIDGVPEIVAALQAPKRTINSTIWVFENGTRKEAYRSADRLISVTLERQGEENKFFGFGICQKLTVEILDKDREIELKEGVHALKLYFSTGEYNTHFPTFYVKEVKRDEKTNNLTVVGYDRIYTRSTNYTVNDLDLDEAVSELETEYITLEAYAYACASRLGLGYVFRDCGAYLEEEYPNGANFNGTETLREVLDAIAEATQTIYYVNQSAIVFKQLTDRAVINISKSMYFELECQEPRMLKTIISATDLGENVAASVDTDLSGETQVVRNNPFWDLREDVDILVQDAIDNIGGLTIIPFNCSWRGIYLLEIGDCVGIEIKDGTFTKTHILNDTIKYDGGMTEESGWTYERETVDTASNPNSLGEAIKSTYARVDKINKEITIVASETKGNTEAISQLQVNTDSITASVKSVQEGTEKALGTINGDMERITKQVEAQITAEDVSFQITTALSNGIDKVETTTGYTFNEDGLTVSKTGTEMKTTITEDGMTVYRDDTAVLTANHNGVDAVNLHASTYLIVGTNSRFENYGTNRTGCFWIGG